MKNVIILGSGRSGTSMVTGTLSNVGYFMGENLWESRASNPKGFFEDREVNEINEDLLAPVVPSRLHIRGSDRLNLPIRELFRHHPIDRQRWLARIPLKTRVLSTPDIDARIRSVVKHTPYCLKDPRFSYALSAWKPHLAEDTVFVCVFRDPASTASSILKECVSVPHLKDPYKGIKISRKHALGIWHLMYRYILEKYYEEENWLFLHYNQALTTEGLAKLSSFVDAPVDYDFPDSKIRRTFSKNTKIPKNILTTYKTLCQLANYKG